MSYIVGMIFTEGYFVMELLRKAIGSRASEEDVNDLNGCQTLDTRDRRSENNGHSS
jgi:hypothetical protein